MPSSGKENPNGFSSCLTHQLMNDDEGFAMKSIGYLVTSLSVAGLLGIAVATNAADKAVAEKIPTDKPLTEKTAATADRPDCDKAGHRRGARYHGYPERGDGFARGSIEDGPGNLRLDNILRLTEDQRKTLTAAREKEQAATLALREKSVAAREAIFKAAESNASDEDLAKLAANSASVRAQLELSRIKMHRQLVAILTPEQKQKLSEWEASHKHGRHDGI
jgi:Spy/CpxP family protein refolding chaperone